MPVQKIDLRQQINKNPAGRAALEIIQTIRSQGHQAYLVGGGVRDMLLGFAAKDLDIATSAHPDDLTAWFSDCYLVGAKFGVVLVRLHGESIEVATFREEGEYHDRRRPDLVRFSTLENDARRRDFTSNALYYDPTEDQLVDMVGGVADIENRVLRCVGTPAERFNEDALRIMRAVRFAANLRFEIEPATWQAAAELAPTLKAISTERVRDELLRGFCGADPARFLHLLDGCGILKLYLPEVLAFKGCEQPPQFHPEGDVYKHVTLMLRNMKPNPSVCLAMSVLLHDIGKPPTQTFEDRIRFNNHDKVGAEMAGRICRRLKLSNAQVDCIVEIVRRHMQFINVPNMKLSTLKRFLASPDIKDELELHRLDCIASHGNTSTYEFACAKLLEFRTENKAAALPPPLITGNDLIRAGFKPGPSFADALRQTFDAQLEGRLAGPKEALAFASKILTSLQ